MLPNCHDLLPLQVTSYLIWLSPATIHPHDFLVNKPKLYANLHPYYCLHQLCFEMSFHYQYLSQRIPPSLHSLCPIKLGTHRSQMELIEHVLLIHQSHRVQGLLLQYVTYGVEFQYHLSQLEDQTSLLCRYLILRKSLHCQFYYRGIRHTHCMRGRIKICTIAQIIFSVLRPSMLALNDLTHFIMQLQEFKSAWCSIKRFISFVIFQETTLDQSFRILKDLEMSKIRTEHYLCQSCPIT